MSPRISAILNRTSLLVPVMAELCPLKIHVLKSQLLVSQNMTVFKKKNPFKGDQVKMRPLGLSPNPTDWRPYKKKFGHRLEGCLCTGTYPRRHGLFMVKMELMSRF